MASPMSVSRFPPAGAAPCPDTGAGRHVVRLCGVLAALALAFAAAPAAAACAGKPAGLDRLICGAPELAALAADVNAAVAHSRDHAADPAGRAALLSEQKDWLDGRRTACPAVAVPRPDPAPGGAQAEAAIACLKRIYEQRLAVLRAPRNAAAWPRTPFLPSLIAGAGAPLCEALESDLLAGFRGRGRTVDPLGEREIGFAPQEGLGDDDSPVLRADFDLYNTGKPVPVLEWVEAHGNADSVEYRVFASPAELLAAIGRGIEPLSDSVRRAAHPWIAAAALSAAAPGSGARPVLADAAPVPQAQKPRFFEAQGHVYALAAMSPAPGKPGDLAVYQLSGPARASRLCTFQLGAPAAPAVFAAPVFAALARAAGPLTPTGRLCRAPRAAARLVSEAAWRPWALDRRRWGADPLASGKLQIYMRNRAFDGPETARDYGAYEAARTAAIAALAPYYRGRFGRGAAAAKRLAALYADRLVALGFEVDPDDSAALALFEKSYADEQKAQQMALAGDTAALRAALGGDPKERAAMLRGELDEPLVTDALPHPDTLRMLLALGLDPNERGPSGHTPLMTAARLDLIAAARLLLAHGASPDLGAGDAVAQSDRGGDPECLAGGGDDAPGRTALSYAVEFASPDFVRLLLDHGASPQTRDGAGRRPADYLKRRRGDAPTTARIAAMLK